MSGIGSPVLAARYNTTSTSQRLLEGDAYLIVTTASIDSATRTWYRLVSRDARIS
jgi:3-oxoacyl-ACP reductase-like protein